MRGGTGGASRRRGVAAPASAAGHAVTAEVSWTASDFAVFGACLLGAGLAFEGTVRKTGDRTYRSAVGVALAQAVVTGIVLLAWDSPDGALLQILSLNGFFVVC